MNLFLLAEAAKFVETNNLTAQNKIYKAPHNKTKRRSRSRKVPLTRTLHNELEKKRRAHMRQSQQELRAVVPQCRLGFSKHTMLGLLVLTRKYILELNSEEEQQATTIERLAREEEELRKQRKWQTYRGRRGYSVSSESSNCSVSSLSSTGSNSPESLNRLESICDNEEHGTYCDNFINIIDDL